MAELSPLQVCKHTWLAFSAGTSEAEARTGFRARYGSEPELVGRSLGNVLAGPVPTEKVHR